ncbi:homeobox-DDT domain protein RLT1 isoform X2 [Rhodamnia argentea]|uniref:Homeobox-DDT domain protein RLT1 isoform X2 n=1 Tax=Rhodamnia argentea TaxID=178133 RepID=A0A8B8P4Q2_9MYRT|nr:homeobox-DDT domain protein RLT1 isoform X2 [Rhodamnia argentea]
MEGGSDGEDEGRSPGKAGNSGEGQSKPKRQMKTPFQLETLEKAYAMEMYPSEAMRAGLSEKLGLTDRQLQMWFCHRRLKDKSNASEKKSRKSAAVVGTKEGFKDGLMDTAEPGSDYGSGSGSGSSPYASMELQGMVPRRDGDDSATGRRCYESPKTIMELRAIACVEAQLGEPLREDGPILGMEFDPLPPDAFGAPIDEEQKRLQNPYDGKVYVRRDAVSNKAALRLLHHEYQFLHDQPVRYHTPGRIAQTHYHDVPVDGPTTRMSSIHGSEKLPSVDGARGHRLRVCRVSQEDRGGKSALSPSGDDHSLQPRESFANIRMDAQQGSHPFIGLEDSSTLPDGTILHDTSDLHIERKHKNEEARIAREVEANENRIRKALEKESILRRKSEERMRKEMERLDRERRKEEERLIREQQREEERLLREQRREIERREKYLQKESVKAEKKRQKEELRREKEAERRKAAVEKATARRIAKESMELMEDEQLELMELAAASKGLPSIVNLDHATMQNLEMFRDSLSAFPPQSVRLKRPFAAQPWTNSEENIGNLLMAWRFFLTFADVLGLWPCTLDEFVQAFHDYDSRLLGELHVALLKSIIKDIEDVARTPATGLGMNQNNSANPEGGHPQIVEGAYAWGFDIVKWQKYLNPLTWPEILRQLALSAGFGPQLKKRAVAQRRRQDIDEVKGCEEVLSTLRSGSAAEKALTIMREKGLLLPRRSRHRLTPGTVKFAAFHVLSLEGSKGLTVLELADKIQKSGLRDLTTSKTPEASISVALTRDTKLFERIAPSTYRVRSAYRKDPVDAESILAEARKKIRIFENGILAGEDADEVEREDEGERDEEFEGDVDEDPEVDDLAPTSSANNDEDQCDQANACPEIGKENVSGNANLQNEIEGDIESCTVVGSMDVCHPSIATQHHKDAEDFCGKDDQESVEIDESKSGESWIRGLTEGEYSHLSVEERLNALVALIGIANEGNSIRAVLEDRLEAASALKKQMWVEAQLDKSRLKDEFTAKADLLSLLGSRTEFQLPNTLVDGSQSSWFLADNENNDVPAVNQISLHGPQSLQNDLSSAPNERFSAVQDSSGGPDNFSMQYGHASKRSRSQLKSYIAHRAEEIYVYRSLPLGQDRRRNRYWWFVASASKNDPGSGRIFVELHDNSWRLIDSEEAFDALLMSLDTRGIRESHLRLMLLEVDPLFKENIRRNLQSAKGFSRGELPLPVKNEAAEMDSSPDCPNDFDSPNSTVCASNSDSFETSSSIKIELGRNEFEKKAALKRYQDLQKWMWRECCISSSLSSVKVRKKRCDQLLGICDGCLSTYFFEAVHCQSCHKTFCSEFDFSLNHVGCEERRKLEHGYIHILDYSLPLGIRLIKALLAYLEVYIPSEALQSFWLEDMDCRKTWGMKLNASSSTEELLQMVTLLEGVIKREYLLADFELSKELLGLVRNAGDESKSSEAVSVLPWIPRTTAAVALRLFELDSSITCVKQEKSEPGDAMALKDYMKLPVKPTLLKLNEIEPSEGVQEELQMKDLSADVIKGRNSKKRGLGSRDRSNGRMRQRRPGAKPFAGKQNALNVETLNRGFNQQGRGYGRGRRTVRRRRTESKAVQGRLLGDMMETGRPKMTEDTTVVEEWGAKQKSPVRLVTVDNSNSTEEAESDDNEVAAYEFDKGNWEVGLGGTSNGWDKMEVSDEDVDSFDNNKGIEDAVDEDSEGDADLGDSNMAVDTIPNGDCLDSAVSEDYSE